jgi:transposase
MISFSDEQKLYVYNNAVDMRKSIDGLSYLVCEELDSNPQSASVFIFHNKQKDKLKLLYWHKNGFVMLYKRLEKGKFKFKRHEDDSFMINNDQLSWLLAGLDFMLMNEFKDLNYEHYF